MEPVIGIVVGLVVAAAVVLLVHRTRARRPAGPEPRGGQGGEGIPPDPGASRPAGPAAERQDPAPGRRSGPARDDGA